MSRSRLRTRLALSLLVAGTGFRAALASAHSCPYSFGNDVGVSSTLFDEAPGRSALKYFDQDVVAALDYNAVMDDLDKLMTDSQPWWPADHGNYGGLFIRMAWHCAGTYRMSDGRGGCDGARQRFEPERSWPDNANLDKARKLLWPIKKKYGNALTWGDLMVLAGDAAIRNMGGPLLGFCGGRIDDVDGRESVPLGPTPEQEALAPCVVAGDCQDPLGQTVMGLIYVDPEGALGQPDPVKTAAHVRSSFSRMGMNDSETVALIGGGHAFGKVHGACPAGAGPGPSDQPSNPWPGNCGEGEMKGKGPNTYTSGIEGSWSVTPTKWTNYYFQNLLKWDWEQYKGPGDKWQWRPIRKPNQKADEDIPKIMMLTTDVSLVHDPSFKKEVEKYAASQEKLDHDFKHAWYKLVTRDMGPVTRCLGNRVPPPQGFQSPLPAPSGKPVNWPAVRKAVVSHLTDRALLKHDAHTTDTLPGGTHHRGAHLVYLAWACASTFRQTDYTGGCNGARIRFSPQKDWPDNVGMDKVVSSLSSLQSSFDGLSMADLIVFAGTVALEEAGAGSVPFCPGRVDARPQDEAMVLPPRKYNDFMTEVRDRSTVMGLTPRETVALQARPRSPAQMRRLGYSGSWTANADKLTNEYYEVLLRETWENATSPSGQLEFRAKSDASIVMTPWDMAMIWDDVNVPIAQEFAYNQKAWLESFVSGWVRMMNADRFDGPGRNVCADTLKPGASTRLVSAAGADSAAAE